MAGSGLLLMAVAAAFSYGYAHAQLLVEGDAEATLSNLISQSLLFKAEIGGWVLILLSDVAVAGACYLLLKPVHPKLSLLGGALRLLYSVILGAAVWRLFAVLPLVNRAVASPEEIAGPLGEQIMSHLQSFESVWSIGLIMFGAHLLVLGILAFKARGIPKWVGLLLLIASAGYLVTHTLALLGPDIEDIRVMLDQILTVPMAAGELAFALWLLFKGGRKPVHA